MEEHQKAMGQAIKLLARREHSRLEMEHKLRARRYGEALIETVLDECESQGWLDDARFADVYGRGRIEAGFGPLRIMAELEQRGIKQMPACVAEEDEQSWLERCRALYERRFGAGQVGEWDERARRMRFLQRRGFAHAHIQYALKAANLEPGEYEG